MRELAMNKSFFGIHFRFYSMDRNGAFRSSDVLHSDCGMYSRIEKVSRWPELSAKQGMLGC
jgi:hypothetical protein